MRTSLVKVWAGVSAGLLVLAIAAVGCGGSNKPAYEPGRQQVMSVEIGDWQVSETVAPGQGWPWPDMADVPPFPGTMAKGASFVHGFQVNGENRMGATLSFDGVTSEQFRAYAMLLRQNGYQVGGLIYYNTDQEAAARRGAAGDVDRVVATKGPRRFTISAPSAPNGNVRFDFDGLTQDELAAIPTQEIHDDIVVGPNGETYKISARPIPSTSIVMPTLPPVGGSPSALASGSGSWPAAWAGRVPEPAGCVIKPGAIRSATASLLYLTCSYADADLQHHQAFIAAYEEKLVAAGFTVTDEQKDGTSSIGLIILTKGSLRVTVMNAEPEGMIVTAQ
jgi:hypothetical protein